MTEEIIPILWVENAKEAAKWYSRLDFIVEGEHQFEPNFPIYMFLRRGKNAIHLSEHQGDATPNSLVYLYVENIDEIATEFEVSIKQQPWGREIHLSDPDGNHLRLGQSQSD
ncbi:hypothetical protein Lepto7376_1912 [[Leptolyngbya] sp. PCC 7376]|uniref:glyoxalase superfamily protein n=1 Tax=[Leptolyngbya] sp. PCC 7376 TaxID=111781 RepID=UPI00029F1C2C|nr:glyoxalase superfamily protein [[Leptolyngbya] sp. PCC 7376]AFY38229.1 hypothetical protein Lepto7376_1912 [[Leptolyngbya] sp. PCC 7376]